MGLDGRYSVDTHRETVAKAAASGQSFGYTKSMNQTPVEQRKVHENLDPSKAREINGVKTRESRDSAVNPNSTAVAVFFDVTGSMSDKPRIIQLELPKLMSLLVRKGYVSDPQILWGAVGDAAAGCSDRVPLQIGQFESSNAMETDLDNLYLEGGGCGGNHESYELAAYFMARHTSIDCWENRREKGKLFFVGDERIYKTISAEQVARVIGVTLQGDIPTADIFKELQEKWDVWYIFIQGATYRAEQSVPETVGDANSLGWKSLLPETCLILEDASGICGTIALAIGMSEGKVDLKTGIEHLREEGLPAEAATGTALATYNPRASLAVIEGEGSLAEANEEEDVVLVN